MAGFIQPGDIINFGRLAWDIYRYGWSDDLNASECLLPTSQMPPASSWGPGEAPQANRILSLSARTTQHNTFANPSDAFYPFGIIYYVLSSMLNLH